MSDEEELPDPIASRYARILNELFDEAYKAAPFDVVCTMLRVGGYQMEQWDPFEETLAALNDYSWMLERISERGATSERRLGLLMYCQAVEMDAVHGILANLLRCKGRQGYSLSPLGHLGRRKKKKPTGVGVFMNWVPPSATQKFTYLVDLATKVGCSELKDTLDSIYDENIRNAFSHSDYVLTEDSFRYREGGLAQQIPIERLDKLVHLCLTFYGVFAAMHRDWLMSLGRVRKFHRWPNYEVLELLSDAEHGLYGFRVHFSTGMKATFMRRQESGTIGSENIMFGPGGISFNVGGLDDLEPVWKINGTPVEDWEALP